MNRAESQTRTKLMLIYAFNLVSPFPIHGLVARLTMADTWGPRCTLVTLDGHQLCVKHQELVKIRVKQPSRKEKREHICCTEAQQGRRHPKGGAERHGKKGNAGQLIP